jgi:hypothetical protein
MNANPQASGYRRSAPPLRALRSAAILGRILVPRYFNLLEAEALLPKVQRLLQDVRDYKLAYEENERELNQISQKVALLGGMVPPRTRVLELRASKEAALRGLKQSVEQFEALGCLLKDLDTGLVDFPTLYRGKEVYLCWKAGESAITFWHRVEDGFAGRKAIDGDFLANHEGERPV